MQNPLQVTFRDIPQSDAVESRIRGKVEKLEKFYPHIIGCKVVLEMPRKHVNQGKIFNVRIDLIVPQGEIVVNRHSNVNAYVAIRDAFDALGRRLQDFSQRQRIDVKQHEQPIQGRIARVFVEEGHGYGFIETEEGQEFYFTDENMTEPEFAFLYPGVEVEFIEGMGSDGLQAKRVSTSRNSAV